MAGLMDEGLPLISVIVPVYNVEKYINKCINSIINQTYRNLEIILIDDGSIDKSPQICDEYANRDNRIIVIHKKNEGQCSARNYGLDLCHGEYISFVDSDDYIEEDYYQKLFGALKGTHCELAISGIAYDNWQRIIKKPYQGNKAYNNYDLMLEYLTGTIVNHVVWNKLYKSDLIGTLRFPNEIKKNEDVWFTTTLLTRVQSAILVENCYYFQCIRFGSLERSEFGKNDYFILDISAYRQKTIKEFYPPLYQYVAYEMVKYSELLMRRILLQHKLIKNKTDYSQLLTRFKNELMLLPREYKNGNDYIKFMSVADHQFLFKVKYEIIGVIQSLKRICKKTLNIFCNGIVDE